MARTDRTADRDTNLIENSEAVFRISAFQYNDPLHKIMERDVCKCKVNDPVRTIAEVMAEKKISSAVVTDDHNRPIGIITERDLVRKIIVDGGNNGADKKIADIMTPDPVCLPLDATLFDAMSVLSMHSIKHLPIVSAEKVVGIVTLRHIMKIRYAEPLTIIGQLESAKSLLDFKRIKDESIYLVKEKLEANTDPVDIVTMLSLINSSIHRRLLRSTIDAFNTTPPVNFCFFVTGSHGRQENLLFPDQDFCIITEDYDKSRFDEVDNYFQEISQRFSDALNKVGFIYCPGNIMGQNPEWRKSVSEWKTFVSNVFKQTGPYTVRYMTLIFDSVPLYGSTALFNHYINHAFLELSVNHNILRQMHDEEEGTHKVPLGLFNSFITEKEKGHKGQIDMKKSGLIFMIESARILALKYRIRETTTMCRIRELVDLNIIQRDDSEYFENAYRVILYHTLKAQVDNYLSNFSNDYYLTPHNLSRRGQEILKESFKAISKLKGIVGSEFGELIL